MELTAEQQAIVDTCVEPHQLGPYGKLVRVIAGAGTGKTTVCKAVADKLLELGHTNIDYVVFNKAAATEAQAKFNYRVSCATLHSYAFRLLGVRNGTVLDIRRLKVLVQGVCKDDIDMMMSRRIPTNRSISDRAMRQKLVFYILKTVEEFCRKAYTEDEGFCTSGAHGIDAPGATYYPAHEYHSSYGLKDGMPSSYGTFYIDAALKVWKVLDPRSERSEILYDTVIKAAELEEAHFYGTALIVDEAQDLTESNLKWLTCQAQRSYKYILVVGDEVQTIYGFRGCRAKYLNAIAASETRTLTLCWRFGPAIAAVANTILYAKQNSLQPHKSYRLQPRGRFQGELYSKHGFPLGMQRTFLAHRNITLLERSLQYLQEIPGCKFAFNGKSEASGKGKFKTVIREVTEFMKIYTGESDEVNLFDFNGKYTWDELISRVEEEGLDQYVAALGLILCHKENTMNILREFQLNVLNKSVPQAQADVVLSTIHTAKGMEWDNVEIGEDLVVLNLFTGTGFDFPNWGDSLNLWYVAVTRARIRLVLPTKFLHLLDSFDMITQAANHPSSALLILPPWEDAATAAKPPQTKTGWFRHQCNSQLWRCDAGQLLYRNIVATWVGEMYATLPHGLIIDGVSYGSFKLDYKLSGSYIGLMAHPEPEPEASPMKRPRYY